jgi:hypothetical protein
MLLDIAGAAAWLGVSERDVERRLRAGTIPCRQIPSATNSARTVPRFHPDDLDVWSRKYRTGPSLEASGGDDDPLAGGHGRAPGRRKNRLSA